MYNTNQDLTDTINKIRTLQATKRKGLNEEKDPSQQFLMDFSSQIPINKQVVRQFGREAARELIKRFGVKKFYMAVKHKAQHLQDFEAFARKHGAKMSQGNIQLEDKYYSKMQDANKTPDQIRYTKAKK